MFFISVLAKKKGEETFKAIQTGIKRALRLNPDFLPPASSGVPMPKVKPPLGIMPETIWREKRMDDLLNAIGRYNRAEHPFPEAWITEYYKHLCFLNKLVPGEE